MIVCEILRYAQDEKLAMLAYQVSGRHGGGETPVPIPNTAVKPSSADGTVTFGVMGE